MTEKPTTEKLLNRRDLEKMVLAAAGGLLAGAISGCGDKQPAPKAVGQPADGTGKAAAESTENVADRLLADPHICRGINTCANKGKSGTENKCAGQAHCATVVSHDCIGLNDCKGHGGCGEHPGENACKGKGACAVPLTDKTWPIAREHFEALMKAAGKTFGDAPAKEG